MAVEKQLSRIQRWLDRCKKACRSRAWGSALAEMECLEAEVRMAREELWKLAAGEEGALHPFRRWTLLAQGAVLALAILLGVALPLSVDSNRPDLSVSTSNPQVLEWVTPQEAKVLDSLRNVPASSSRESRGRAVASVPRPIIPASEIRPAEAHVPASSASKPRSTAFPQVSSASLQKKDQEKSPVSNSSASLEDVISLIQVGQKALHSSSSAVNID